VSLNPNPCALIDDFDVRVLSSGDTVETYMENILAEQPGLENNVYIYDLGVLHRTYQQWLDEFPGIHPYYAIKCNPDLGILRMLCQLGANFDCASPAEIDSVLAIGADPSRIIYANPCKRESDIRYAADRGVRHTTFDTVQELHKIARAAPEMRCVLRLFATDPNARCQLSNKFGAPRNMWQQLISVAKTLDLCIDGISFHVGSGACTPAAFTNAIEQCRELYDMLVVNGYTPSIIDLGGGFMPSTLGGIPDGIRKTLETYFPTSMASSIKVIAEPGRFFAERCATLMTKIIGVRDYPSDPHTRDYWITDGIYGSFNCMLYDHIDPKPHVFKQSLSQPVCKTTLFGPTCDGMDTVLKDAWMPRLEYGDWIYFKDMGAYTIAGSCHFNGIPFPNVDRHYIYTLADPQK